LVDIVRTYNVSHSIISRYGAVTGKLGHGWPI